ncbi:MAG TPA: chromate efflux transporter [Burkholderiales bacterium]|nr:chromate efflux transporter [Burkholderiales bacterium]
MGEVRNSPGAAVQPGTPRIREVFLAFLKLGLTSFGGPIAHLGYFREEFVVRRKWLGDKTYSDLVALCQLLPGPASSQVGIALGVSKAGLLGGFAAWLGFTLPSALALVAFGYGIASFGRLSESGAIHGLKVAAVAVVALAVWGMGRTLCPDAKRASLAVLSALLALVSPSVAGQVGAILACGLIGRWTMTRAAAGPDAPHGFGVARGIAMVAWCIFFGLLIGLPLLSRSLPSHALALFDSFYRSGSLVFGGGHVVLPLLRAEVVPPGWVTDSVFLAGYGAAQAVPGPLFTFAAYLGTVMTQPPTGWLGASLCLTAIFLPSFLLVVGALPLWEALRGHPGIQAALTGINAGVVGLLLAALYDPVWTGAIRSRADFGLALVAFVLLAFWKISPVVVVVFSALAGWLLGLGSAGGEIF